MLFKNGKMYAARITKSIKTLHKISCQISKELTHLCQEMGTLANKIGSYSRAYDALRMILVEEEKDTHSLPQMEYTNHPSPSLGKRLR